MSRNAEITLRFADEDRLFRLPIGRWRALQQKCDVGPLEMHMRLSSGTWRVDDLRETLLQGLYGGGMDQAAASKLVDQAFDGQPFMQFLPLAQAIVMASVIGAPDEDGETDDPPGEPKARRRPTAKGRSRAARSASPTSTSSPEP